MREARSGDEVTGGKFAIKETQSKLAFDVWLVTLMQWADLDCTESNPSEQALHTHHYCISLSESVP